MNHEPNKLKPTAADVSDPVEVPVTVERATLKPSSVLCGSEKAHTREGDAIAAARRRLPMVEVDPTLALIGPRGPVTLLDVFEGRRQLIAYYHMWYTGEPRPSSARAARSATARSASCPTCMLATSPTPRSAGPVRGERALPRLHGLGRCRGTRPRTRSRRSSPGARSAVPPGVLPAGRRPRLRDLLDHGAASRRWTTATRCGPHRVRPPGDLGGLARRLAPAATSM